MVSRTAPQKNHCELSISSHSSPKDLRIPVENFKCSNHWIRGVCRRNKISSRAVTHQTQQDNSSISDKYKKVVDYLAELQQKTAGYSEQFIFNMDETPCYFDMTKNRTMHFKGEKTVEGLDTGHTKIVLHQYFAFQLLGSLYKHL